MESRLKTQQQRARHLAARAVMAFRANFPISSLSIVEDETLQRGIVCDWRNLHGIYGDDNKLLQRGFAFIYIGTIIDQTAMEPTTQSLQREVSAEMSDALEAREAAVLWGLVPSITDTDAFAHSGYKLASRLLRQDRQTIEALADTLLAVGAFTGDSLKEWLDSRAGVLDLVDLERSISY